MSTHLVSIVLFSIYVIFIIAFSLKQKRNKNSEDYFLASRKLPAWLLSITFIASWWGGGSAIDLADHAHRHGLSSFWIYGVPVLIATAIMYLFAKGIRNIASISQPQLMAQRYNSTAALFLTLFIVIFMVIGSAVQIVVIGNFFHSFFSINYEYGAMIGVAIVLIYSFFGGFKSVVLTDLMQFVFFVVTQIILLVITYHLSGGLEVAQETALANGKEGYTSFFHNWTNYIAYVITFGASWTIQANVWQRISAAKNSSDAKKIMAISFLAFIPLYLIVTYTGILSSVIYPEVPKGGVIGNLVADINNPIIGAVIFVGLCSAIMSTLDSLVNTGALSLTVDIYQKYINKKSTPKQNVFIGRASTLLIGMVALFIALRIKSILTISWIGSDFLTTGAFVPLILAFVWKKGTAKAAIASMAFGLLFSTYNLLVAVGLDWPICWEIASTTQAIIGIGCSLFIFILVSLTSKKDTQKAEAFISELKDKKVKG